MSCFQMFSVLFCSMYSFNSSPQLLYHGATGLMIYPDCSNIIMKYIPFLTEGTVYQKMVP